MWLENPRNRNAPFAGLKVVELARILAGPFAGQVMADLGADVVKVESPAGDDTRQWGSPWISRSDGSEDAAYFHACNRGKRGLVADFGTPDDLAKVKALIAEADVVIENFKVGSLAKFGLDYVSLAELNPRLVYCSITGFGQTGPYAERAGYDFVIQAMSGLMSITGEPEGAPMKLGVAISDLACGLWSVIAIQAALAQRERTGRGQHIDMALLDCSVALLANQAMARFATETDPPRMGNAHGQVAPYELYQVADGQVVLAVGNDGQFAKLTGILGHAGMADDPRFATNPARVENRGELNAALSPLLAEWRGGDLLAKCEMHKIPAGPVNGLGQAFQDEQVIARKMVVQLPGEIPSIRSPFNFSGADLALDRASPMLGAANDSD